MQSSKRGRVELPLLFAGLSGSVFFLFFGLAVGGGLLIDLGLLGCVGLSVVMMLLAPGGIRQRLRRFSPKKALWGLVPLVVYLILDFGGFLFSEEYLLIWEKYRVTALLLAVARLLLLSKPRQAFDAVFTGAGAAAAAASLLTLLRYFSGGETPLPYLLRFSLRRDYNMYAAALLIGWICLFFWLTLREKRAWALAASLLILPVLGLSGSRRVLLALPVALAGAAAVWLLPADLQREKLLRRAATLLLCTLVGYGQTRFLEHALLGLSIDPKAAVRLELGTGGTGQTAAGERYETIGHSSLFTKRRIIWGIALRELVKATPLEWCVGRGGGENIRLYDRVGEELDPAYPDRAARLGTLSAHNALLADLIDGGLLKASALIWLLAACGWGCLRLLYHDWRRGLAVGIILGFTILSNFVSNRYGLLYDRGFLLFYPLLLKTHSERSESNEPSDRNADHPASP